MPDAPHTLSVFDDDLDQLRALVSEMGGRVEASIHDSVTALVRGDEEQALGVTTGDAKIDELAARIEKSGLRMIALRMPLAGDLRDVLAALKIAGLVARMGDCTKNIAFRARDVGSTRSIPAVKLIQLMEAEVSAMVKAALDAFVRRSASSAVGVRDRDRAADGYNAWIVRELLAFIQDNPERVAEAVHLLFVAQKLERIGDHAAAIAEIVHFAATGDDMPPEAATAAALETAH